VIFPGMMAMVAMPRLPQPTPEQLAAVPGSEEIVPPAQRGLIPAKYEMKDGKLQKKYEERAGSDELRVELDYNLATPMMLINYFPTGLLGLGLTALMASFMSGMAGNVTAFNTVWTYDIYESYIAPNRSDSHYLWMGRFTTVFGVAVSVAAAYVAAQFNNIMDLLQLVFAFVNAPLLATFLLGMFWRRATGHGAFTGLVLGTLAAAAHQATTAPKGAWIAVLYSYRSEMAQNFWTAILSFSVCFVVSVVVSLATQQTKPDEQLRGLVYSLTPRVKDEPGLRWYQRPAVLAVIVLTVTLALNFIFF